MKLLERIIHKGEQRIVANMPFREDIVSRIKQIKGRRWSASLKAWHFPDNENTIEQLKDLFPEYQEGKEQSEVNFDISIVEDLSTGNLIIKAPFKYKEKIKMVGGAVFDYKSRSWLLRATEDNKEALRLILDQANLTYSYNVNEAVGIRAKVAALRELPALPKGKRIEIDKYSRWLTQKRRSESTIKTYTHCLTVFFRYYHNKDVMEIGVREIEDFNFDFIVKNGYSATTQSQYISAIKTYYLSMLGIKQEIGEIERPVVGQRLPKIIAKEDVERILKSIRNRKHRLILSTIYGLGLRRSEIINLRLEDIDFNRNVVMILNGKGQKDRVLPLPLKLKSKIIEYIEEYEPKKYLIEGAEEGEKYSSTSVGKIFKKYVDKVIKKHNFTPHSLRHSYATHLLDNGVDIRFIQELLGHKSSRTTEIYTHVSMRGLKDIRNPLDDFDL